MVGHQEDTKRFESFREHLRAALAHLYDPAYQPCEMMWAAMDIAPRQGTDALQSAFIQAIEGLRPQPGVPSTARIWRIYQLLFCRYVQDLTQEETAERLSITPRHVRREQRDAVDVLARRLWGQWRSRVPLADDVVTATKIGHNGDEWAPEAASLSAQASEWHSQVKKELASLQKAAPDATANVGQVIRSVVALESSLTFQHGVHLETGEVQTGLYVAIHPSALRQALITAIGELTQRMLSGQIALLARRVRNRVSISIAGSPTTASGLPDGGLIDEIMTMCDGSVKISQGDDQIAFYIELPSVDKITVLIIDDNLDLVHFYRRYTAGTKYQIIHVAEGGQVSGAIERTIPDVIVLDVMLPDIDGWELLTELTESPATREIPVIVCSVIREQELALACGAALYLPKPVRRRQFLQALEQVADRTLTKASRSQASSGLSD